MHRRFLALIIGILLSVVSCKRTGPSGVDFGLVDISHIPRSEFTNQQLSENIAFAEQFVASYRTTIDSIVGDLPYRDSFYLPMSESVRVYSLLSGVAMSSMSFVPSESASIVLRFTQYPVDMALMTRLDIDTNSAPLLISTDSLLAEYDSTSPLISFDTSKTQFNYLRNGSFMSRGSLRLLDIGESDLAVLLDIKVGMDGRGITAHSDLSPITLIFGGRVFSSSPHSPVEVGNVVARKEIVDFLVRSSFFKRALGELALLPIAEEIINKRAQDSLRRTSYPIAMQEYDLSVLQDSAIAHGFAREECGILLNAAERRSIRGIFLWYYSGALWLMLQWSIMNCLLFLAVFFLRGPVQRLAIEDKHKWLAPITVILGMNTYFSTLYFFPSGLALQYWILPWSIAILGCVYVLKRYPIKSQDL